MGSIPLSVRFDEALLERLRRRAAARSTTPSGLAQRLVDEGLRSQEHPGITFRDGPSGRRAGLITGPDIWEVIAALRYSTAQGEAAIGATAGEMDLSVDQVKTALDYYAHFPSEVDAEVEENELAAQDAERAWRTRQLLLG